MDRLGCHRRRPPYCPSQRRLSATITTWTRRNEADSVTYRRRAARPTATSMAATTRLLPGNMVSNILLLSILVLLADALATLAFQPTSISTRNRIRQSLIKPPVVAIIHDKYKTTIPVAAIITRTTLKATANTNDHANESGTMNSRIRVGIVGAGSIALGTAALLARAGHDPMLWSPSGQSTKDLTNHNNNNSLKVTGALDMRCSPRIATLAQQLVQENSVLILAVPANGHKVVMDLLVPHMISHDGTRAAIEHIIISSHASLGALYLAEQLRVLEGPNIPITAWGTTVVTARRQVPSVITDDASHGDHQRMQPHVRINTIRKVVDICTIPNSNNDEEPEAGGQELCRRLFGMNINFRLRPGLLAITLSNVNPQNHLGIVLGNLSRMEHQEQWYQSRCITPKIGSLLEHLDQERLAIADALGIAGLKTVYEHFRDSFHVPIPTGEDAAGAESILADMNQQIHQQGNDVLGPNTADSRYVTEDVPFGLVPLVELGKLVGRPALLHQAGIQILSAMYQQDFCQQNDLWQALDLEHVTIEQLQEAARTGQLSEAPTRTASPAMKHHASLR